MNIFDEATPLLNDIGDRLLNQRLPVVAYVAAVILESALRGIPPDPPPIMAKVLDDVQEMLKFMVVCESERLRATNSRLIQ